MNAFTIIIIIGALYFLPSMIACVKTHRNLTALFVLNLLLGWTVIGWVGALVWSLINQERPASPPDAPQKPVEPFAPRPISSPRRQPVDEVPLPIIQMDDEPKPQPVKPPAPPEQEWVRQAKAEMAAARRK